MRRWLALIPVALLLLAAAGPAPAPALRLALPIDCTLGRNCAIQNYPDDDPGAEARAYACHGLT